MKHADEILAEDAWADEARLSIAVALTRWAAAARDAPPEVVDRLLEKTLPASPAMQEELDYAAARTDG